MKKSTILLLVTFMFLTIAMEEPPEKSAKTIENPIVQQPASLLSQSARQAIDTIMNTLPEEMTHYLTTIAINEPINKSGKRWLHMARTPEDVYKALALGADVNIPTMKTETPLNTILANGYIDAAIALVTRAQNVDLTRPDIYGTTPLHNAAFAGNKEIIALLIPAYATLDIVDWALYTPLFYAIVNNPSVVSFLIESGAQTNLVNRNDTSSLHLAAEFNSPVMQLLIDHGAKEHINSQNIQGRTPLHMAAYFKNNEAVNILLENGANPNIPDSHHRTPIFYTSENPLITKTLLAKNADVNIHDARGTTSLMYAAWNNNYHTVKKLLKTGKVTTLNDRNLEDNTALYYAIESQNPKTVTLLLLSGAQVRQKDYDLALSLENEAIKALVQDAYVAPNL